MSSQSDRDAILRELAEARQTVNELTAQLDQLRSEKSAAEERLDAHSKTAKVL